jgi:hypothetical protein
MSQSCLEQRRGWFRFFPSGSIEFVVITRVLALLLMLLLLIAKGTQRPFVFLALCGMLWADYLLTLSWLVQLGTDVIGLTSRPPLEASELSARRARLLLVTILPATFLFAVVAPWAQVVLPPGPMQSAASRIVAPILIVAFIISLVLAWRKAQSLQLGPSIWMLAALVPLLHWLGVHRLLGHIDNRIRGLLPQPPKADDSGPSLAATAADVLWIMTILPWFIMVVIVIVRGVQTVDATPYRFIPICGAMLFGVFSVVDLAAMEVVQRRFLQLIRSL